MNLLLVDDDTALVNVIAEALHLRLAASHGVTVHLAATWDGATEVAKHLPNVDVLLVDYHLGPHTGTKLCLELRKLHPAMRTLLYTGKATAQVDAEARACGMRVLWKPQRLKTLTEVVRELLDSPPR